MTKSEVIVLVIGGMILLNIIAWFVGKELGIRSGNKVIEEMNRRERGF